MNLNCVITSLYNKYFYVYEFFLFNTILGHPILYKTRHNV
jgi:hypothetical protein